MDPWLQALVSIFSALMGASGLWSLVQTRRQRRSVNSDTAEQQKLLMLALTYDVIVTRGMIYIDRGSITKDEYEDFRKIFYEPYKKLGGNGVAEQIMTQVSRLPLMKPRLYFELTPQQQNKEYNTDGWRSQGFNRAMVEQPHI